VFQASSELTSVSQFRRKVGVHSSTVWRWIQRGWIGKPINISGRLFFTTRQVKDFEKKALRGDFAVSIQPPPRKANPPSQEE
jgi:predicted site-specific integrase-resolvase